MGEQTAAPSLRVTVRVEEWTDGHLTANTRLNRDGPGDFLPMLRRLVDATAPLVRPFVPTPDPNPMPRLRLWGRR